MKLERPHAGLDVREGEAGVRDSSHSCCKHPQNTMYLLATASDSEGPAEQELGLGLKVEQNRN